MSLDGRFRRALAEDELKQSGEERRHRERDEHRLREYTAARTEVNEFSYAAGIQGSIEEALRLLPSYRNWNAQMHVDETPSTSISISTHGRHGFIRDSALPTVCGLRATGLSPESALLWRSGSRVSK